MIFNSIMTRNFLLLSAILFLLLPCRGVSQVKSPPTTYSLFVSGGYGNTTSANVSDYYNSIVDNYRAAGIPIQTQTSFGPTVIMNAAILFYLLEDIGAGVSFGYLYSPAFSNYQDYAGIMKIDGAVDAYEVSLKMRYTPVDFGKVSISLSPQIGVCHTQVQVTQEVKFNDFQDMNYNWKMTKKGWGPCLQGTVGGSMRLGEFTIALEAGYRYTGIQVDDQTEETNTGTKNVSQVMDIGLNGFYSLVTIGINLR